MRDILFPVSSSSRTDGTLQYVGNLAHDTHAKVFLVPTDTSKKKVFALSGTHASVDVNRSRADEVHDYLTGTLHVENEVEKGTFEGDPYKRIGPIADRHDMMVVPLISDSHSADPGALDLTKIINETKVPLFLIPDGFKYKKVKCLIYAYDYKHEPEPPLLKLSQLASWFGAEVRFMSVFAKDTLTKERDKVSELHIQLLKAWKGGNKISFDTIVYPQIPKFEEHYLGQPEQGDLQVLTVSHQNFLDRLLRRSLMDGIMNSKYPYVIIHR